MKRGAVASPPSLAGEGWGGSDPRSQFYIGRYVLGLDAIDGQARVEPFPDLLDAAVVIDPGVEEVAPALVRLHAYPHAGRYLHPRLMQHLELSERPLLLDCRHPQIDSRHHA